MNYWLRVLIFFVVIMISVLLQSLDFKVLIFIIIVVIIFYIIFFVPVVRRLVFGLAWIVSLFSMIASIVNFQILLAFLFFVLTYIFAKLAEIN